MSTQSDWIAIRPHEKQHKEKLFIMTLYSTWDMSTIATLLNLRFNKKMIANRTVFDEDLTQQYYDYSRRTNNKIWLWAKDLGESSWRVRRTMKWARGVLEGGPLVYDSRALRMMAGNGAAG